MAGTERRGVTIFKKIQKYCNDLLSGDTNRVGIRVINNPDRGGYLWSIESGISLVTPRSRERRSYPSRQRRAPPCCAGASLSKVHIRLSINSSQFRAWSAGNMWWMNFGTADCTKNPLQIR